MRTKMKVLAVASLAAATIVGCHGFLDVQNPGPIEDTSLYSPESVPPLVIGMSADLSNILSDIVRITGIASDELGHGGSYTQEGLWVRGIIRPEDVNDLWARMQRVRYEAESGVERMKAIKGFSYDTDANAARANLLGGFANRMLDWQAGILILPVVYVIYRSYNLYLNQLQSERRQAEEARRELSGIDRLLVGRPGLIPASGICEWGSSGAGLSEAGWPAHFPFFASCIAL